MRSLSIVLVSCLALTAACSKKPSSRQPVASEATPEAAASAEPGSRPAEPKDQALSAVVLALLEKEHLLRKKLDDEVSREAFSNYLNLLDGGKMFLLSSDRDALAKYADKLDDQLRSGSFDLAYEGAQVMAARVPAIDQLVASLLRKPFDHSNQEWIELDPKKLQFAATEEALANRWRQRLELEVLERVAQMETRLEGADTGGADAGGGASAADELQAGSTTPLEKIPRTSDGREALARKELASTYSGRFARLRSPAPQEARSRFLNAIASSIDPHTTYLPPDDQANFDIAMTGSLQGIGAVLRERDHHIEVVEIVPGGASAREGRLGPGDLILSVSQEGKAPVDVVDMPINEVVRMIRGPKDTVVTLRVQKPTGTEETIAITRDVVVVEETYARGAVVTGKGLPKFGYIQLPSFYGDAEAKHTAAGDVRRLLAELKAKKVRGVVLDLRSNGGGLLGDAIEITGHFIDSGPVVQVQNNRGRIEKLGDEAKGVAFDGPVVVMVDRFSASASEIVAGALQDYKRAIIVGTGPTHGKGTVQVVADLDRALGTDLKLGVMKFTVQQFFRVSGASTQQRGVVPDILLPDPTAHIESGERELPHAIPYSEVAPAQHDRWPSTWKVTDLSERSTRRVLEDPSLTKIAAVTQVLRTRQENTRVPLKQEEWKARRKELSDAMDLLTPDLKGVQGAPVRLDVKLLDEERPTDRTTRWRENLSRDPWVDESLHVLGDMVR